MLLSVALVSQANEVLQENAIFVQPIYEPVL